MIKVVVFDCWNTLFTTDMKRYPFQVFAERMGQSPRNRDFMKSYESHLMASAYPDLAVPVTQFLDDWGLSARHDLVPELVGVIEESIRHHVAFPDTVPTLVKLKDQYKLVLLTNSYKQGLDALKQSQRLDQYFDLLLPSYEMHHIKPDNDGFKAVMSHYNLPASEIVMIGDNLEDDILSAKKLGLHAILLDRRGAHPDYPDKANNLEEAVAQIKAIT